ncbi:hypothetical protein HHI36_007485 [Cryptolaemus montrouzieri]|uniref:Maturase K n=1 Tax=Cryptolaemus montrouzieri TaxID=559131 RepID=A0ABD2MQ32_9CUCU
MWKQCVADLFCYKFDFGVPLDDLFPPNDLHPKIELMYSYASKSLKKEMFGSDIVSSSSNQTEDLINLRKMVLNSKYLQGTPQSFLWLIEHFLGLLPIPLLPPYLQEKRLNWLLLSKQCKGIFQRYHETKRINYNLDDEIVSEMSKLPPQHSLLLDLQIRFMREISFFPEKLSRKKSKLIYYTKYFTASIFLRPFRSGLEQSIEKEYRYIILYMVLRWPFIQITYIHPSLSISELEQSTIRYKSKRIFK